MQKLSIDLETFSDIDLIKCGVYKYADSPNFEILLFAYSVDDGEVKIIDLANGEQLPAEIISALKSDTVIKTAYNAQFERVCLSKYLGEILDPRSWYCTAVQAAELSFPASLADVGSVLGLERQKMTEGKELIRYFCIPCKSTKSNGNRTRNLPCHDADKWDKFKKYCVRDVEVERAIAERLKNYQLSESEHDLYVLDQRINDRGVLVDLQLAEEAVKMNNLQTAIATEQAYELTGLENPNSVSQLKSWLADNGVLVDSLSKKDVTALTDETAGDVQEMLKLRLLMSKTSVKKYEAVIRSVCSDNRVRGLLRFYGANRTGRWSGNILQPQNLPQNHLSSLTLARDIVKSGDFELLDMLYGNVPSVLSELIRTVLIPKPNHRFIVADFSAIEARVLSWLAGETWRIDTFRNGGDIYCASASQMFKVPVEKHGINGHLRQKGKIAELACGYGGSVGALKSMGALEMGIPEEELQGLINDWRSANGHIVKLWYEVGNAAMKAIREKTTVLLGMLSFIYRGGVEVDADETLARYKDWHDTSEYPVSSRQKKIVSHALKKQADPLEKNGIIGAFCRAYTVQDAIAEFLQDVYTPSALTGRYDYIPADSVAGVVVYDDKYAYSHHATDPACGKLCNSFDLVRIHKFGHLDSDDSGSEKSPSFKEMAELARKDDKVKAQVIADKQSAAEKDFAFVEDTNWQKALEMDKKCNIKETLDNIVLIIRHDDGLQSIAFNKHRDGIDARDGLPWEQIKDGWNDSDNASLKVYLSRKYGVYSPTKTKDTVLAVATERAYHPIKDYLDALPEWDGVGRVDKLLIDYFGAEDNSYTKAVIRKTMVAAVARIYKPGTKFDSVLILNGPQGIGKSTFFAKLAGRWFSDSLTLTDMKDKSGPEKLQGYWILELGELAGMRKTDVETVKSFISRVDDKYRASYGVNVENHPRQCVIVGSTNTETGFLRDITGNRRFWPVKVRPGSVKKSWQLTDADVDQIWAETVFLYNKGEKLYLEGEEADAAVREQTSAMETDEREGLVRAYLNTLLPENWSELSWYERRNYLNGSDFGNETQKGTVKRRTVSNIEIWCECFGREASSLKKTDSYEIASIMRKIPEWERSKDSSMTLPIYGKQRIYVLKEQK